ncbi:MAG: glucose 1-dehydrogenase [Pirellulales bacterium]
MTPATDRSSLAGQSALVTGASRGIGAAIARGLGKAGAKVVLSSRKQESVEQLAAELRAAGCEAAAVAAHMGQTHSIRELVEKCHALHGGLDIVVNNAATNPVFGPAVSADEGAFDKIMAVNLRGPFTLARLVFPSMQQRGGGVILNIGSVGGLRPEPMLGLYSVSKAALISLTQVLAQEGGDSNIRVNAICPGLVRTKFSAALWQNEAILSQFLSRVPLGRMAEPEEIAALALFLCSPAASYCTGGVYAADGGHMLG